MGNYDPAEFWTRFQALSVKDLPVTIKTGIKPSTLSVWRIRKTYPRADDAVRIAEALDTTVEYLVTGADKTLSPLKPAAVELALTANELSVHRIKTLLLIAKGLLSLLPKKGKTAKR
jgi:transcriptional regulator with XRE-family HTH domain